MAKPNYSFEKRQRELAKKKKQEVKRQKKAADRVDKTGTPADGAIDTAVDAVPPATNRASHRHRSSLPPLRGGVTLRFPLAERHHSGGAHVQT